MADLTPTDADFEAAFVRRYLGGKAQWAQLKAEARKCAATRLLDANQARQNEICAELPTLDTSYAAQHARWFALQDEIERLFAEHGELLDVAFPREEAAGG